MRVNLGMKIENTMQLKSLFTYISLFGAVLIASCNPQKRLARQKHTYMENTYKDVKKSVTEAEVSILNDTLKVLFPENLLFKKGGADINEATYPVMQRFANALLAHRRTDVLVNGHTDNTGSDEVNQRLSRARADSAASALIFYKVPASRLSQWGFGSRQPIADNGTEEGRTKNRRVEFIILYKVQE